MENTKDLIYLAMLVRGLRRISKASGQDDMPALNDLIKPIEQQFTPIMEKAEMLSLGDLKYPEDSYHIPNGRGLQCIQDIIKTNKSQADYIQPMMPVSLDSRFFPVKKDLFKDQIISLWKNIKENIENQQYQDIKVLSENILNVLFRFAVSIPSTETNLDVSLYDQTRVAAAIAICLYDLQSSGETNDKEVFRLIGGDFSGIQSYIYQIVSKYAGKNLKGRSFYLNILADAVVRKILKELSLYRANIVYNSGGCFYILAPNTSFVRNALNETIRNIEQKIFEAHGTQLFVAIDSVTLSEREIANKEEKRPLNKIWQELFLCRDNKKSRRYADTISHNYAKFFTPQNINGIKRDIITGEDFASDEKPQKLPETFGENAFTSEENYAQIKIGQELKETDVMIVSQDKLDFLDDNHHAHICPANLGQYYYLADLKDINNKSMQDKGSRVSVIFFNGKNFNTDYTLEKGTTNNICSLQFYGGNYFNGNTFEEMCDNEGLSRLGVLRMDVDNLGSIFQSGIPEKQSSFARFASLSRSFDYLFSGYLNTICRENSRRDRSFIVYSGGDDVFIVGSWDTTIDIAWQIHKDFTQYTCNNKAFSISGGIAILNAKFPIIAGAQESAEEEERAKGHECGTQKKNSISFLGMPLNWEKEFPAVRSLKKELVSLLKADRLPKSFLSKIMELSQSANYQNHKISNFKVYWLLAYTLKRMKERYKHEETKTLLDRCLNDVCHNSGTLNGESIVSNYNPLQLWAFACRWAELEYRTNNN